MCVCVCVCVCVRFLTFQTPITHKRLEISIYNLVYQWSNHNSWHWCPICDFMGFWFFWKKDVVTLACVKFELSSQNYTQIYYIDQETLVLSLAKIHSCYIFFRFWIFWEFSHNCLTQVNFDLSSWNFVHKCTNTEWCLILNFGKISRVL